MRNSSTRTRYQWINQSHWSTVFNIFVSCASIFRFAGFSRPPYIHAEDIYSMIWLRTSASSTEAGPAYFMVRFHELVRSTMDWSVHIVRRKDSRIGSRMPVVGVYCYGCKTYAHSMYSSSRMFEVAEWEFMGQQLFEQYSIPLMC